MGESRTDVALNVFEISAVAWALTVHKAAEVLAHEPAVDLSAYRDSIQAEALRALDSQEVEAAGAELRRAGIVDANGAITRQWVLAVSIAAFGPLKATAVVQSGGSSVHTELALAGGRGIGVTYARRIRHGDGGVDVREVRNAVEISFFTEENAWAALKRHLPDITEVPEARELPKAPGAALSEIIANAGYTIHLQVSAHPTGSRTVRPSAPVPAPAPAPAPDHVSWDVWALAERLYVVSTGPSGGGSALTPVPWDAIRLGFAWRLLGAREYLASAAEQAA
ncbi:hypothetical protein [Arthrobacter sp. SLBN-100]|uniref:hypothetical protein n=1 Tax=Arthrobacter sp. SLBN-100 TaxID=2768450 RepID=UPI0013596316|nr:hypothetical protein [Arthrobacter sp. SLBN-100]